MWHLTASTNYFLPKIFTHWISFSLICSLTNIWIFKKSNRSRLSNEILSKNFGLLTESCAIWRDRGHLWSSSCPYRPRSRSGRIGPALCGGSREVRAPLLVGPRLFCLKACLVCRRLARSGCHEECCSSWTVVVSLGRTSKGSLGIHSQTLRSYRFRSTGKSGIFALQRLRTNRFSFVFCPLEYRSRGSPSRGRSSRSDRRGLCSSCRRPCSLATSYRLFRKCGII